MELCGAHVGEKRDKNMADVFVNLVMMTLADYPVQLKISRQFRLWKFDENCSVKANKTNVTV